MPVVVDLVDPLAQEHDSEEDENSCPILNQYSVSFCHFQSQWERERSKDKYNNNIKIKRSIPTCISTVISTGNCAGVGVSSFVVDSISKPINPLARVCIAGAVVWPVLLGNKVQNQNLNKYNNQNQLTHQLEEVLLCCQ